MHILAEICTRGRYYTTLPSAMFSLLLQERLPNEFVLYDDNLESERKDLREIEIYRYIFQIFESRGIKWQVIYGSNKGQHYGHQEIQKMAKEWIFRLDDDCVAEPNVLSNLCKVAESYADVGAVGGSILTPPVIEKPQEASSKIDDIYAPNEQWFYVNETKEVDHIHCSFIYRAGVADYDLRLSPKAFREETMFTYSLKLKGYKVLIIPNCITWHLRASKGGIRS